MLSFLKMAFYKLSVNTFSSEFIYLHKSSHPPCCPWVKPPLPSTPVSANTCSQYHTRQLPAFSCRQHLSGQGRGGCEYPPSCSQQRGVGNCWLASLQAESPHCPPSRPLETRLDEHLDISLSSTRLVTASPYPELYGINFSLKSRGVPSPTSLVRRCGGKGSGPPLKGSGCELPGMFQQLKH